MHRDRFVRTCWWGALLALSVPLLIRFVVLVRAGTAGLADVVEFIYDDGYYYLGIAANFADTGHSTLDGISATNGYQPLWLWCLTGLAKLVGTNPWRFFVASCALMYGVAIASLLMARAWSRPGDRLAALCAGTGLAIVIIQQPSIFLQGLEPILFAPVLLPLFVFIERGNVGRNWVWMSALLALAFLVRLDALSIFLSTALVLGVAAAPEPSRFLSLVRPVLSMGAKLSLILIPVVAVYLFINVSCFGTPLPVSGFAKLIGGPKFSNWGVAWMFFDHWRSLMLVVCILLPLEWFARRVAAPKPLFYRSLAIVCLAMVVQCLYYCALSTWIVWPWYAYLVAVAMALIIARAIYLASLLCEIPRAWATGRAAGWAAAAVLSGWTVSRSVDFVRHSLAPHVPPAISTFNQASLRMLSTFFSSPRRTVVAMGDRAGGLAYWGRDRLSLVQTEGLTLDIGYIRARTTNAAAAYLEQHYPIEYFIVDREVVPQIRGDDGELDYVVADPIQGRVAVGPVPVFCFPQAAVRFREAYPAVWGVNLRMVFDFAGRVPCAAEAVELMRAVEQGLGLRQYSLPTEYLPQGHSAAPMNKEREDRDRIRARSLEGVG